MAAPRAEAASSFVFAETHAQRHWCDKDDDTTTAVPVVDQGGPSSPFRIPSSAARSGTYRAMDITRAIQPTCPWGGQPSRPKIVWNDALVTLFSRVGTDPALIGSAVMGGNRRHRVPAYDRGHSG